MKFSDIIFHEIFTKMYIYDDIILVISGSEVRRHDVLAQEWFHDFLTRPNMSIKVKRQLHVMRIFGRIVKVRSTEQSV